GRRPPVPWRGRGGRGRAGGDRGGGGAGGAVRGQRLRLRRRDRAAHAPRRAGPVRGLQAGLRGVRRGRGRPLRQQRPGRAGGLRRGGDRLGAHSGVRAAVTMKIVNPATERVIAEVEPAGVAEADEAVARATRAYREWREVSPGDRARLLRAFADLVGAHAEELAALEVANAGHPIGNARWEAATVRDVLHFYAGAPERNHGRQIPVPGGVDVTFQEPLGVAGVIVPWNFPMLIMSWGVAPALAAGNTVIVKP